MVLNPRHTVCGWTLCCHRRQKQVLWASGGVVAARKKSFLGITKTKQARHEILSCVFLNLNFVSLTLFTLSLSLSLRCCHIIIILLLHLSSSLSPPLCSPRIHCTSYQRRLTQPPPHHAASTSRVADAAARSTLFAQRPPRRRRANSTRRAKSTRRTRSIHRPVAPSLYSLPLAAPR